MATSPTLIKIKAASNGYVMVVGTEEDFEREEEGPVIPQPEFDSNGNLITPPTPHKYIAATLADLQSLIAVYAPTLVPG